jgi:hypothetical protein
MLRRIAYLFFLLAMTTAFASCTKQQDWLESESGFPVAPRSLDLQDDLSGMQEQPAESTPGDYRNDNPGPGDGGITDDEDDEDEDDERSKRTRRSR